MNVNQRDNRLSTPLHWACFTKSEQALAYLLAIGSIEMDPIDENGFSPLHLAVQSVPALNSTRPVRALLLKGANRSVMDKKGRVPRDLIG